MISLAHYSPAVHWSEASTATRAHDVPLMLRRLTLGLGWLGWVAIILAIVVPWGDFQGHTHWAKVAWIPFVSPPVKLIDIVGNIALYLPFGYLARKAFGASVPTWAIGGMGMVLAIATEGTQLYSHWRFPSATDVTANLMGCLIGASLAGRDVRVNRERTFTKVSS